MKPPPAPPKRDWTRWPKELAPSEIAEIHRGKDIPPARRLGGIAPKLLDVAKRLSERTGAQIHEIVVFYPQSQYERVRRAFQRERKEGRKSLYRGLTLAKTPRLRGIAMAFRIEDVENHRTPADPYYVLVRSAGHGAASELAPKALYDAVESGTGEEIHE